MYLIADSGSTKCKWALCNNKGLVTYYSTIGLNPYFLKSNQILETLNKSDLYLIKNKIENIYFYGAGCSSEEMNLVIKDAFSAFFEKSEINIFHDLEAACYAVYKGKPTIAAILGTGSNSCFFDGKKIHEHAPSLGYILGDEASGNYFGKKIISLYTNKQLSDDLKIKYEEKYETDVSTINLNIYSKSRPNKYLASFFPFIIENQQHSQIQHIINTSLQTFFDLHINCFNQYNDAKINFIGSVAFLLKNEISIIALKNNWKIEQIIKDPLEKLIEYHKEKNN